MEIFFLVLSLGLLIYISYMPKVFICEMSRISGSVSKGFSRSLNLIYANNFWQKKIGLLNHVGLDPRSGIFFKNVRSIHTCGMTFEFDLIFLDKFYRVTGVLSDVKMNQKNVSGPKGTKHIIEVGSGFINLENLRVGDELALQIKGKVLS